MSGGIFRPIARERAISCKTLICFLQSLVDEVVTIEQKDDIRVTGRLCHVDAYMNCQVRDGVVIRRPVSYLSEEYAEERVGGEYLVNGTRIRYVHFGDDIDPIRRMEDVLGQHGRDRENRKQNGRSVKRGGGSRNKDYYQDPRQRSVSRPPVQSSSQP